MKNKELLLKDWLREYLDEKEQAMHSRILSNSMGILTLGILIGVILSYTALVPLLIGMVIGYACAKNTFLAKGVPDEGMVLRAFQTVVRGFEMIRLKN